ncbi:MAG: EpsG family protein [Muribaculaceae bacterium]|nr:EpsG family protein [Muribaculaceae bacterium]
MVYLIALIAALIGIFFNDKIPSSLRKGYYIALCVYMILLIGFRYKVGIDTIMYMQAFRHLPSLEDLFLGNFRTKTRFEPGFMFVCAVCKLFSSEFWPVQMVMSAITTGSIFVFIYRYCRNIFTGVVFYIIFQWLYFSLEVMRESAAVGIFLLNYKNLQEKKWVRYYLFSVFSIVFHYSAIIIWFFPFVKWLKANVYFYILCICSLAITPLVEQLNEWLNIVAISGRITMYVEGAKELTINWRLAELLKSAFPAILVLIGYHIAHVQSNFRQFLLLQILLCMGTFAIPVVFARFTNYTALFVTVAVANLFSLPQIKLWLKIVFISLFLLSQAYYLNSMKARWLPYVSIFYPENLPERSDLYRHFFMPWLKVH